MQSLIQVLHKLGLNGVQSEVYVRLFQHGPHRASEVARRSSASERVVRAALDELVKRAYATYDDADQTYACIQPRVIAGTLAESIAQELEHARRIAREVEEHAPRIRAAAESEPRTVKTRRGTLIELARIMNGAQRCVFALWTRPLTGSPDTSAASDLHFLKLVRSCHQRGIRVQLVLTHESTLSQQIQADPTLDGVEVKLVPTATHARLVVVDGESMIAWRLFDDSGWSNGAGEHALAVQGETVNALVSILCKAAWTGSFPASPSDAAV